ncbi:uncharacterized protein LOC128866606 [Anastrepha ludens]|uniref:uncharacterized protein LOC128866606 n=1 Tax=Anastrepha ludens TaxID=28586 RepID=UPI0023B18DEF|nr:uncharacterized protein LOC128866606 [Anastrepha ludens]
MDYPAIPEGLEHGCKFVGGELESAGAADELETASAADELETAAATDELEIAAAADELEIAAAADELGSAGAADELETAAATDELEIAAAADELEIAAAADELGSAGAADELDGEVTEISAPVSTRNFVTVVRLSSTEDIFSVTVEDSDDENQSAKVRQLRRTTRKRSPQKKYDKDYVLVETKRRKRPTVGHGETSEEEESERDDESYVPFATARSDIVDLQLFQDDEDVTGKNMYGFHTPKKKNGMALAALNAASKKTAPTARK